MPNIPLTLACWDYDRTAALADGRVTVEGVDLTYLTLRVEETFLRMIAHREFDVAEMSLSSYTMSKFRDDAFVAIPVFPSRVFRHASIYVTEKSGIREPKDLIGKRVGVPEYQMTAAVWIRGILADEYGVPVSSVTYFTGGEEEPGRAEKPGLKLPPEIKVQPIPRDRTLSEMLGSGELDALYTAQAPSTHGKNGAVRRLFEDYVAAEQDYFRRTHLFPIMHTIVLRRDLYERHRWLAVEVYKAFVRAQTVAYENLRHTGVTKTMLPWMPAYSEATRALMGEDFWPYGLEKNEKALGTFLRYHYDQGLAPRKLEPCDLFAPETLESYRLAMLKPQENERLTRVGPGTPMGNLYRRYWIPAGLSSELPEPDGPPVRVRILGEDLVAFRDTSGKVALVDAYCPHRRAPMFFGRNEECGLRCVYHGWKFDASGACVDMPSEPPDSLFKSKVTIKAYPAWEGGGMIWTYMGPPELQPEPPDYELVRAPETHRFTSKTYEDCNWLQALEGGLDTSHSSFAHNMSIGDKSYLRNYDTAPRLEVERTEYGYTYAGIRKVGEEHYVRAYHYFMPAQQMRGRVIARKGGLEKVPTISGHIWVPIDDGATNVYNWYYSYDPAIPITKEGAHELELNYGRAPEQLIPGTFRLKLNFGNDYMIDRQIQKTQTFTGIVGINTQDFALQEGMGKVVDRSKEHLGTSDRAIIVMRQLLLEAIEVSERGETPRGVDPNTFRNVRAVDRQVKLDGHWREVLKNDMLAKF